MGGNVSGWNTDKREKNTTVEEVEEVWEQPKAHETGIRVVKYIMIFILSQVDQ